MQVEQLVANAEMAERFMKALSNQNRLMILCSLMDRSMSVSELNELVPLSQSALSQHLAVLREHNFVATEREGQSISYRICDHRVKRLMQAMYEVFCGDNQD